MGDMFGYISYKIVHTNDTQHIMVWKDTLVVLW